MKYNNIYKRPNLIFLLVLLVISANFFCACGTDTPENSEPAPTLSLDEAKTLVAQDRKITEMFFCNSLCDGSDDKISFVIPDEEDFSSFYAVESLLDSTYGKESEEKSFFLSYSAYGEKPLSNVDGKTHVFYHAGNSYTDFIDAETITVSDTDSENIKHINAKTVSGRDVTLKSHFSDGKWILEKGIYRSNPRVQEPPIDPTYSNLGSLRGMKGNILVIELYVSDNDTDFTDAQEEAFHEKIETAVGYLTEQSKQYGNEVNVTYESAFFHHSGIVGTRPIDFDLDFAQTSFGSLEKFAKANFPIGKYDNYFFAVCLNKNLETRSCRFEDTETTEIYFAERVSVGKETAPEDLCVRMLELLGTFDYTDSRFKPFVDDLFNAYFPDEFLLKRDFSTSKISPVTAYVCGMTDKLEPMLKIFVTNR